MGVQLQLLPLCPFLPGLLYLVKKFIIAIKYRHDVVFGYQRAPFDHLGYMDNFSWDIF